MSLDRIGRSGTGKLSLLLTVGACFLVQTAFSHSNCQFPCSEPKLFQNKDRFPQFPAQCNLPDPKAAQEKRQLLGSVVSQEEAEQACAHWNEDERKNCISDVLATNDLELANGSGY